MKNKLSVLLILALISFSTYSQDTDMKAFGWLTGSWKGNHSDGVLEEHWEKKDDRTLTGVSYFIMNGDTLVRETLRLEKIGRHWCYIAVINDNIPVLFTLVESGGEKWVFENKEHDFPQRVNYAKEGPGKLMAWIEGLQEGKLAKETYRMEKTN